MKIRVKRVDADIPLPEYKTAGAAGFDFASRIQVTIAPHTLELIALNLVIDIPEGYMVLLASRSSLPKKGLLLANGVGIGDSDFCGPDDEYRALLYNFTDETVVVQRGERVAQGIIVKVEHAQFEEVDEIQRPTRGGIGSTGSF